MAINLPKPAIIAHRGASAYAPENTLAAFKLAVDQGAEAIELDAKLSADGQVIVIHDQTVDRTTNGNGKVLELSLAELKKFDAGGWFDLEFKGEPIPTLAEVFEAVGKKIFINIELTNYASPRDALPDKVAKLIEQHNLHSQILFSSFNPWALRRAHQLLPKIPLGMLALPGIAGAWARSRLGRWVVPYHALHPEFKDVSAKLIARQHARGRQVYPWTVNDPKMMSQLFQWNADGIFTDDPLLAKKIRAQVQA